MSTGNPIPGTSTGTNQSTATATSGNVTSSSGVTSIPLAPNVVQVNPKLKNNPILTGIKNVRWIFNDIVPDFVLGQTTCALYLTLRHHTQYPNYIYDRMQQVGKSYQLQVLLVLVDVMDPNALLKELAKVSIMADFTLICCWSVEEASRIVEQYKMFEKKSPAVIMEKQLANINGTEDKHKCIMEALSSIKSINKTDSLTLISHFESLERIVKSDGETLGLCPGLGPQKAEKLYQAFHKPFLRND
ncbi:DNA excision repair protein ERCC-1-like [Panonychus citri]|uniref:DNA excision repair protein ERCC-1-like n=1 Tax=Panonychus citri TaxID=50023 RepID=UPI002307A687|nr:DNA excision repair protein ERCC-1-like [Panonychus citri]